jgi:hypothetical protein
MAVSLHDGATITALLSISGLFIRHADLCGSPGQKVSNRVVNKKSSEVWCSLHKSKSAFSLPLATWTSLIHPAP